MARPRIPKEEKMSKISISLLPTLLERCYKYCNAEERSVSWVIGKALDKWLTEKGF